MSLDEFIEALDHPIIEWLAGGPSDRLIEDEMATLACEELADVHADPRSEAEQAVLVRILQTYSRRPNGSAQYTRLRRLLIENASAIHTNILELASEAQLRPDELYEPIGAECIVGSATSKATDAHFARCPRCGWPMRREGRRVRCMGDRCSELGARFELTTEGRLRALGPLEAPPLAPCAEYRRLLFGLWRFTVLPGLEELALKTTLERIPGVSVALWPELDRYDLDVRRGSQQWRVDVKDHASGWWLAQGLAARPPTSKQCVIVPDHRAHQLPILRRLCVDIEMYTFHSCGEFVAEVAAREPGHG